jgi:glycosyltransferase involved in cell wall biosynthesis
MVPKKNNTNKFNELFSRAIENQGLEVEHLSKKKIFKIKRNDIVHFHWISSYYQNKNRIIMIIKALVFFAFLFLLKIKGVRIVWTVHNLYPHQYKWKITEKHIRKTMINRFCNVVIAAAYSIKQEIEKEFEVKPDKIKIIPHGHYLGSYPIHHRNLREFYQLDDSRIIFLFVGTIKKYKGIIELLSSFDQIRNDQACLLVAGKTDSETKPLLTPFLDRHNIIFDMRFIPDNELADLILCSDFVVLPYTNVTTSGSAILAASLKRKIITPSTPFMREYFNASTSIMYDVKDKTGLLKALEECVMHPQLKDVPEREYRKFIRGLSWDNIGKKMKQIYLYL